LAYIRQSKRDVWITEADLGAIRRVMREAPACTMNAEEYFGADLGRSYAAWGLFLDTDWSEWDQSEYAHDIYCRSLIQLAIEQSCAATSRRLSEQVEPLDADFKRRMFPARASNDRRGIPLRFEHYFWELSTLHPELRLES